MSYAGVESESEHAQRRYGLVPAASTDSINAARREARANERRRLTRVADDLAANDRISWETAFKRLRSAIGTP